MAHPSCLRRKKRACGAAAAGNVQKLILPRVFYAGTETRGSRWEYLLERSSVNQYRTSCQKFSLRVHRKKVEQSALAKFCAFSEDVLQVRVPQLLLRIGGCHIESESHID